MDKIKTTMSGKEYLQYLKYKEEKAKRNNKEITKHFGTHWRKYATGFGILALFAFVDGMIAATRTPKPFEINPEWLLAFLIVMIGLSWLIHGVGFVLVKR